MIFNLLSKVLLTSNHWALIKKTLSSIYIPLLYLVSYLPFFWLYQLSNFTSFVLYRILGYRKKIVVDNLKNSFPNFSDQEIQRIIRRFYRHLGDMILETIKSFSMPLSTYTKVVRLTDQQLFDKFYEQKRSCILALGHLDGFEWGVASLTSYIKHKVYCLYKPLKNQVLGKHLYKARQKTGVILIESAIAFRKILQTKAENPSVYGFIADQSPSAKDAYWTTFLNRDTAFFSGIEKISVKLDLPVIYLSISKPKRGECIITPKLITDQPKLTEAGYISEQYVRLLEEDIKKNPEIWLWSHKRWKKTR